MTRLILALSLVTGATTAMADNPLPPVPDGGLRLVYSTPCVDIATQVEAFCTMSEDRLGNVYVYVEVDGEPWEIRQIVDDGYAVIWSATNPIGISL